MDGRGLVGSWFKFFWNLIRSTVDMCMRADGVVDLIVGLFVLVLVATIVVVPLLVITLIWIVTKVAAMIQATQSGAPSSSASTGASITPSASLAGISQPDPGAVTKPLAGAGWQPTHASPAGGLPAWDSPDPSRKPVVSLGEGVDLAVDHRTGDWALVRGSNGWRGWVDARQLVPRT